jgi:flavorubredoxin
MMSGAQAARPVTDLASHIPLMEAFHRRYMVSNKVLRLWVRMVRQLEIPCSCRSTAPHPGPAGHR